MFSVGYGYDLAGDPTSTVEPNGFTVATSFNRASRPQTLGSGLVDANHPSTLIAGLHYNAAGEEASMVANTDSGFQPYSETRCYGPRGALQDVAVQASATVPTCTATSGMAYWLQVGLEPNQAPASASDSANGSWTYSYDDFNRIASASGPSSYSFAYDRQGNRWQQNLTAGSGPAPSFTFSGSANQMDGYSFDAAGNLLSDGRCSYSYDDESRTVAVGTCASEAFVYDAEGQRVGAPVGGTNLDLVHDLQGRVIEVWGPGRSWWRGEIYANGRQLATYANGTTYLTFTGQPGTVRTRYNVHGNLAESCQDLAFGDGLGGTGCGSGDPSPQHFAGQARDYTSGLDHMGARDYASMLGRWLTPDPASAAAADPNDPQTWDRYAYALNNPATLVDPTGLLVQPCETDNCSWDDTGCTVDGMSVGCDMVQQWASLLGGGGMDACPQNACHGTNALGLPVSFHATVQGTYWGCDLPGVWGSSVAAGLAAEACADPMSIVTNTEYSGNVYSMANGEYSFTTPGAGTAASSTFDTQAVPDGTTFEASYHTHGAFDPNYLSEMFSPRGCNGNPDARCDIGLATMSGKPMFLATPDGRLLIFDPAAVAKYPNGCVLVGTRVPVATGASNVPVPLCH